MAETYVGVDDPYKYIDSCDYITQRGKCLFSFKNFSEDIEFSKNREFENFMCPVFEDRWSWSDCPHFKSLNYDDKCRRCGLKEIRMSDQHPLIEKHHVLYPDKQKGNTHEITLPLCRWCHARIHNSGASIDDKVDPPDEAVEIKEKRLKRQKQETDFSTANKIYNQDKNNQDKS